MLQKCKQILSINDSIYLFFKTVIKEFKFKFQIEINLNC